MILNETYTLSNSVKIPKLGLGTWMLTDGEAAQAVRDAVAMGYRHIDTAQAYGNEAGVGEGIRTCGIARDELFVTSKVAAENKSYDSAAQSIDETLRKTELDYIDMMIIHSPQPWAEFRGEKRYFEENREVWRALEDAYKAGKVRAIGLSNFLKDDLENILNSCEIKPMVNQILAHISNTPLSLIDFCNKKRHSDRGLFADSSRRGAEKQSHCRHRREILRHPGSAVRALCARPRHDCPAQDREPGAYEIKCRC